MVTSYLCALCRPSPWRLSAVEVDTTAVRPSSVEFSPAEPTHCYGGSDHVNPGVLGGYRCSCACRSQAVT